MGSSQPSASWDVLRTTRRTLQLTVAIVTLSCGGATRSFAQSGSLDPSFIVGTGANNRVFSMVSEPDGDQVLGGSFTTYNGSTVGRLARLGRTGSLDASFNTNIGIGANSQVTALALDASGRIFVGGSFSLFNGVARSRFVCLNSDGTVDGTFSMGSGFGGGNVNAIAVDGFGRIHVAGTFTSYNGTSVGRVVRLLPDGSLDATYDTGTGANNELYACDLDDAGRLVIAGLFTSVDGVSRRGIARLNTDGSVDTGFAPGAGMNGAVFCVNHQRDGKMLLGGLFTAYNGSVPAPRIARLNSDGSFDGSFTPGSGFNSWVYTIVLQGDGRILAGGDFTSFNGNARGRMVRLNTDGTLDTGFSTGTTFNNWVYAMTWQPEGKVTVAGGFTAFNGVGRNRIVRLLSGCDENITLYIRTDAFGSQTSWELLGEGFTYPICSGSGYASDSDIEVSCCVPRGCMRFRLMDSAGDGFISGGYVLRDGAGERIIDNAYGGSFGSESSIAGNASFCLPMGTDKLVYTSCDKLDWLPAHFVVAAPNAAVSAQWGVGDQTNDGYEFWFYDPSGSYSQRRFRSHATEGGYGSGATRACYQRLSWSPSVPAIPEGLLLNVRVRGRVNGVNNEWGPACRLKVDPIAAACPTSKLMDIPGNPFFSCGVTRTRDQQVTARPVNGANKYQFEFANSADGYVRVVSSTNYFRALNWTTDPLIPGRTYNVRVRISRNGGTSWCPYGETCTVTIAPPPPASLVQEGASPTELLEKEFGIQLYPNPSAGDRVEVLLTHVEVLDAPAQVMVLDLSGKLVHQEQLILTEGQVTTTLGLERRLAQGQYLVRVASGDHSAVQRLVVTH